METFRQYYSRLVKTLPMNDDIFTAELYTNKLLPGDLKEHLESLPTSARKASKFLDIVIKPSIENNDVTRLSTLLIVMTDSDDSTVKRLAKEIQLMLDRGSSNSETGYLSIYVSTYLSIYLSI